MKRTCAHCARPQRGYAAVGDCSLCHPDDGLDCYWLVAVYKHPIPCQGCQEKLAADPAWVPLSPPLARGDYPYLDPFDEIFRELGP